jgi:hypothetical protein
MKTILFWILLQVAFQLHRLVNKRNEILFALKLKQIIVEPQKTCLMAYRSAYFSTSAGIAPNVLQVGDSAAYQKN